MRHSDIQQWLRRGIAQRLGRAPETLGLMVTFDEYGIDSLEAVNFTCEIENFIGHRIEPATLWDHRTVWELSVHLAETLGLQVDYPEDEAELDALLHALASK